MRRCASWPRSRSPSSSPSATRRAAPAAAHPQGPPRREEHLPRDPRGPGGDEAAIFASDLYRMYQRYAEGNAAGRRPATPMTISDQGGFKQVVALIEGKDVYSHLKYEAGHPPRPARPRDRDAGPHPHLHGHRGGHPRGRGRRLDLQDAEVKIDTFRASGRGRTARQPHRLGHPHHPRADRAHRAVPVRALPAQEQGLGPEGAQARGCWRERESCARVARPARPGRQRGSLRAHPHLQLPAVAHHRPPHQL